MYFRFRFSTDILYGKKCAYCANAYKVFFAILLIISGYLSIYLDILCKLLQLVNL